MQIIESLRLCGDFWWSLIGWYFTNGHSSICISLLSSSHLDTCYRCIAHDVCGGSIILQKCTFVTTMR
jgi:hypothetical protein